MNDRPVTPTEIKPVCVWELRLRSHRWKSDLLATDCGRLKLVHCLDEKSADRICRHCGKHVEYREITE